MPKDKSYSMYLPVISNNLSFECCICLENKITISQPCMMDTHRICMSCITRIVKTMPISRSNPEICCQYPYSSCDYVYSKNFIRNVLKEKYIIYKIAKDVYTYYDYSTFYCQSCSKLLVIDEPIEEDKIYECIYCFKRHCSTCNRENTSNSEYCITCDGFCNINPMEKNLFFYKAIKDRTTLADYFLSNEEITPHLVIEQLIEKLKSITVKCPVCTSSIFRTEKCNALKHCHVEICFSCGQFSKIGEELLDHWSARGHGCPRWETDPIFKKYIPNYICEEEKCYSHISGECSEKTHESGIDSLNEFKKQQYVYHSLKSLLPRIRYKVLSIFPEQYKKYLPSDNTWDNFDCNTNYDRIRTHILPPGNY